MMEDSTLPGKVKKDIKDFTDSMKKYCRAYKLKDFRFQIEINNGYGKFEVITEIERSKHTETIG